MIKSMFAVEYFKVKYPGKDLPDIQQWAQQLFDNNRIQIKESAEPYINGNGVATLYWNPALHLESELANFTNWLKQQCQIFAEHLNFSTQYKNEIHYFWINELRQYSSAALHCHAPSPLICIFYIKKTSGHSNLRIRHPNYTVLTHQPIVNLNGPHETWFSEEIDGESGDLIILPGYLLHSVDYHALDESRISVQCDMH